MPVELIVEKINEQKRKVIEALCEQDKLLAELKKVGEDAYDWVSVQTAAKMCGVSVTTIYRSINSGYLHCAKKFGSRTYIKVSELNRLDDGGNKE